MYDVRFSVMASDNPKKGNLMIVREELRDVGGIFKAFRDRDFEAQYFDKMSVAYKALDALNDSLLNEKT